MTTGLDVFDKTVQESNLWLKDLMERLGTYDRHHAYSTLRAVLHGLRDRIGPESAAHLGAQLPMLLRGLYYEGWDPRASRARSAMRPHFSPISRASCRAPTRSRSSAASLPCSTCCRSTSIAGRRSSLPACSRMSCEISGPTSSRARRGSASKAPLSLCRGTRPLSAACDGRSRRTAPLSD